MEREELIYHIDPEKAMKFQWFIAAIAWRVGYVRHNVLHWAIYNETGECCEDEPIAGNEAIMMYSPLLRYGQGDIADDSSSEQ